MNCIGGMYGTFIWLQNQVIGYAGLKFQIDVGALDTDLEILNTGSS